MLESSATNRVEHHLQPEFYTSFHVSVFFLPQLSNFHENT